MLKIKDEVNLNDLAKYGFRFDDYNGVWYCSDFTICKNKVIRVHNGNNWDRNDKLFDLIQDNLIEKINKKEKK